MQKKCALKQNLTINVHLAIVMSLIATMNVTRVDLSSAKLNVIEMVLLSVTLANKKHV